MKRKTTGSLFNLKLAEVLEGLFSALKNHCSSLSAKNKKACPYLQSLEYVRYTGKVFIPGNLRIILDIQFCVVTGFDVLHVCIVFRLFFRN